MRFRAGSSLLLALLAACKDDPTTGSLVVSVSGLPAGVPAAILVEGPSQYASTVTGSGTLELAPGEYTIRPQLVTHSNAPFTSAAEQPPILIEAGRTSALSVGYALSGGSIALAITGLPAGTPARVRVVGPDETRTVDAAGIVAALPAGAHLLIADTSDNALGDRFAAGVFAQVITVEPSLTSVPASVTYALFTGTLDLGVTGLPAAPDPSPVTVAGPAGFVRLVGASTVLHGLPAGAYSVAAATHHESCPLIYTTAQSQQLVDIAVGETASRSVAYTQETAPTSTVNLKIDGLHLTQITQDLGGAVPLLAGKEALLRVYGTASETNTLRPKVRITLSNGTVFNVDASEASVRGTPEPGIIAATWNAVVPASVVQAGLAVAAEIDPENRICEVSEADNRFPAQGTLALDVRQPPTIGIRFVSVRNAAGHTGAISSGNVDVFLAGSRKLHPVADYDAEVRPNPYTTTREPFESNDENGSWGAVLSELNALRVAEGSNRYYHGIIRVTYNSGLAGLGQLGGKTAMTWDRLPSASEIVAHELGHNYARFHAPCGNPGGPDPNYPQMGDYAGGKIGQVGYELPQGVLKLPAAFADYMSYCRPVWTSDYTYKGVLNWLLDPARGNTLPARSGAEPALLVWGRIVNGAPVLEPPFVIETTAPPPVPGPHRVVLRDAGGAELASVPFGSERVADLPTETETFAFALPLAMMRGRAATSIAVTTRESARATRVMPDTRSAAVSVARAGAGLVRVRWDAGRVPALLLRDPASGAVLSIARGGDVTIVTDGRDLDVHLSDQSIAERRRIPLP